MQPLLLAAMNTSQKFSVFNNIFTYFSRVLNNMYLKFVFVKHCHYYQGKQRHAFRMTLSKINLYVLSMILIFQGF